MKHSELCLKRQENLKKWYELWPNACRRCGAWGVVVYDATRDDPGGSDPCSSCLESGVCPRCGDNNLNFLTRGSFEWGYCHVCGWDEHNIVNARGKWAEMVAPDDGECDCWWEEEQDDQRTLQQEMNELEEELLQIQEELDALDYLPQEMKEWNSDPVRYEDDAWWFYDELWVERYGPYEYESVARVMLDGYKQKNLDRVRYFSEEAEMEVYPPFIAKLCWERDNQGVWITDSY